MTQIFFILTKILSSKFSLGHSALLNFWEEFVVNFSPTRLERLVSTNCTRKIPSL